MLRRFFIVGVLLIISAFAAWADLVGEYRGSEASERDGENRLITLEVSGSAKEGFSFSGGATFSTGRGASPDFSGELWVDEAMAKDGEDEDAKRYWGWFEDSFYNRGIIKVSEVEGGISATIKIVDVHESRCLALYGEWTLKRAEAKK